MEAVVSSEPSFSYDTPTDTLEGGRDVTSDLPGVDHQGDVDVSGGGKLAEVSDGHVLGSIEVERGMA